MKRQKIIVTACAAAAGLVSACGSDHNGASSTSPQSTSTSSSNQMLDTAQVLALARQTSETSTPIAVNGGAVTLTDTSETAQSASVNGM